MSVKHTVRSKQGNDVEMRFTPLSAIKFLCKECLGWEEDPENCTSPKCPVYPFRTGTAHSGKVISEAQRAAFAARMAERRSKSTVQTVENGQNNA